MNRPGVVPQNLRGMPAYGAQQAQQPGRGVSSRIPNGKLAGNGAGWFGGGPMGGAGIQNATRQLGGNVTFAQSLTGSSQPNTPLDLSDFPSLSTNSQLPNPTPSSMWGGAGAVRNIGGGPLQRNQPTPLSAQQGQQDDMFSSSSRLPGAQTSSPFRFGNQASIPQANQPPPSTIDDFPPLNRNANGDIGQERASTLISLGFGGSQPTAATTSLQSNRSGNGLLNALSANTRAVEGRSPISSAAPGSQRPQDTRSAIDDDVRQTLEPTQAQPAPTDTITQTAENRNPLGAIGNDAPVGKSKEETESRAPEVQDPLAGMPDSDKFGMKGLRALMNNHPDYSALVCGVDPATLGLEFNTSDPMSKQIFSLFDDTAPRPAVPQFRLPDCYHVTNVQPLEAKISNFNEETLMWIFYSCPGDQKQHSAAVELHNRNWRWHRKLQMWLTKDDAMIPHVLSPNHERGYYIIWDTANWRKERREFTLYYADLETSPGS